MEHSIEVYDDKSVDRSILTRSARIRKFKFYQYKRIEDPTTPKTTRTNFKFEEDDEPAILCPRDDVLQGKVGLSTEQPQEFKELDNQISDLEKKIAELNSNNLDEIFELVNRKNDLIRRQMQLNILEQEKALEKANEELTKELRSLMSIEDSKKSKVQLERQQHLYEQSLDLVNKRNELVLHMDVQEKGIDEDNALKATLKSVISDTSERNRLTSQSTDRNCSIQ